MNTKYTLNIEAGDSDSYTRTEYQTNDYDDLRRFLQLSGIGNIEDQQESWNNNQELDIKDYQVIDQEPVEYDFEDGYIYEDEDDRDDATYDYGKEENISKVDRVSSGYSIDAYDYKGREDADGLDQRLVNNFGNNPLKSRMSDEIDEEDIPSYNPDDNDCSCSYSEENYKFPTYTYEVDNKGNVVVYNEDNGMSVYLQGSDALEIIQSLVNAGNDTKKVQIILSQYEYMMKGNEEVLYEKMINEWKNFK